MKLLSRYLSCTYLAHHELESVFIRIITIIIIIVIIFIIIVIIITIIVVIFRYGVPALTPSGPL